MRPGVNGKACLQRQHGLQILWTTIAVLALISATVGADDCIKLTNSSFAMLWAGSVIDLDPSMHFHTKSISMSLPILLSCDTDIKLSFYQPSVISEANTSIITYNLRVRDAPENILLTTQGLSVKVIGRPILVKLAATNDSLTEHEFAFDAPPLRLQQPAFAWNQPRDQSDLDYKGEVQVALVPSEAFQLFGSHSCSCVERGGTQDEMDSISCYTDCEMRMFVDGKLATTSACQKIEKNRPNLVFDDTNSFWCLPPSVLTGAAGQGVHHVSADLFKLNHFPLSSTSISSFSIGRGSDRFHNMYQHYSKSHAMSRAAASLCSPAHTQPDWEAGRCMRALVYSCPPQHTCGGLADRIKGILSSFLLAILSGRSFFIDFSSPFPLHDALRTRTIDWRLEGVEALEPVMAAYRRLEKSPSTSFVVEDSRIEYRDVTSVSSFKTFATELEDVLEGSSQPVWIMTTNIAMYKTLLTGRQTRRLMELAGLTGLYPSPTSHLFRKLFNMSEELQSFISDQIGRLKPQWSEELLRRKQRWLARGGNKEEEEEEDRGQAERGWRGEEQDSQVFVLQLRTNYEKRWRDPHNVGLEDIPSMLACLRSRIGWDRHVLHDDVTVVISDSQKMKEETMKQAASEQYNTSKFIMFDIPRIVHIDRDDVTVASQHYHWVFLEFFVMTWSDVVFASSGFGTLAADIGGLPPSHTIRLVPSSYVYDKDALGCFPTDLTPWISRP